MLDLRRSSNTLAVFCNDLIYFFDCRGVNNTTRAVDLLYFCLIILSISRHLLNIRMETIDISKAFDSLDHNILLSKL